MRPSPMEQQASICALTQPTSNRSSGATASALTSSTEKPPPTQRVDTTHIAPNSQFVQGRTRHIADSLVP
jgi:hypothetical protein